MNDATNGLGLAFGVIAAAFAYRKGFNPFLWILSFGLIGLIILAFLPAAEEKIGPREESERNLKRGDAWGASLTTIAVLLLLASYAIEVYDKVKLQDHYRNRMPEIYRPQMNPRRN